MRLVREIFSVSWWIIGARFATYFLIVAELIAASGNDTVAFTEYALANYINMTFWILELNFLSGVRLYSSQALGRSDQTEIRHIFASGLQLALLSSIFIIFVSLIIGDLFVLFGYIEIKAHSLSRHLRADQLSSDLVDHVFTCKSRAPYETRARSSWASFELKRSDMLTVCFFYRL